MKLKVLFTKQLFTMMLALVAMTTGAWAATDYGFQIDGYSINSDNCSDFFSHHTNDWSYDASQNVLYLNKGVLNCVNYQKPAIYIDSNVNPNLKIQVDGNFFIYGSCDVGIKFNGNGSHTICGNGTLTISPASMGALGIFSLGNTKLTIQDLTINITTIASDIMGGSGFENRGFSEIYLTNCEMNIKTDHWAWFGASGYNSVNPIMTDCYVSNGYFKDGGIVDFNPTNSYQPWIAETSIKRCKTVSCLSYTVDQPTIGQPLHRTAIANGEGYSMGSMSWKKEGYSYEIEDGYVCKVGETYQVVINSVLSDNARYSESEPITAVINGKSANIAGSFGYNGKQITYTFPQLANTYYDLWIGGKQVNDYNQKDVLGDGKVKYIKSSLGNFLYLTDATITNTGDTQYDYTGYGRGIYSKLSSLSVSVKGNNTIESNGEGIYFTGDLTLLGGGTLSIKGSSGIRTNSQGTSLSIYGIELTAEATSGTGIGGTSIGNKNCTMSVSGENTIVKACGPYLSIGNLKNLELSDGVTILQPTGAYFSNNNVRDASGIISGPWVVIRKESSIATGLEAIDNGQLKIDNASDEWYTIDGQKLSGMPTKKGIYIHNGNKLIVK